jgi:prolyl-tRNA synthetase
MRITEFFLKTERSVPKEIKGAGQGLLYRGGFFKPISQEKSAILPLGMRVQANIVKIIVEKFESLGAHEIKVISTRPFNSMSPRSQQWTEIPPSDQSGTQVCHINKPDVSAVLGLVASLRPSYKDLPIRVYQVVYKLCDQAITNQGVARLGESLAIESDSFEANQESLLGAQMAYRRACEEIFNRLGLKPVNVPEGSRFHNTQFDTRFVLINPGPIEDLDMYWDGQEEILEIIEVDCSLDSKLYRKILRFYGQHPEKTLKNEFFKSDDKEVICVTLRGDFKVDQTKLKSKLGSDILRPLGEEEIKALGSYPGFISALGLSGKVRLLVDDSVRYNKNYWDGGNRERVFRRNVNFERDFENIETVDVRKDKISVEGNERIMVCDHCSYRADLKEAEFVREKVNLGEEMKELMMVAQPEWVNTMDDNVLHYHKPKSNFIKNVVYKDRAGRLIIAVIRGDLEANPEKISKILGCGEINLAGEGDFSKIDTQAGWVHSWGHDKGRNDVIYICDKALLVSRNLIGGYKEATRDAYNVNYGRDFSCAYVGDIAGAYSGAKCDRCTGGYLQEKIGWELGHVFSYSSSGSMVSRVFFVGKDGKESEAWRETCRLNVGMLMSGIAELHHDERGIIWPPGLAPFDISLVSIGRSPSLLEKSKQVYEDLLSLGWDVLWDDREGVSAGAKFIDLDLIGNPIRIVLSDRTLKENQLEIKLRSGEEAVLVELSRASLKEALDRFKNILASNSHSKPEALNKGTDSRQPRGR